MKLRAPRDRVILKRIERPDRSDGGLFIPQTARDAPPSIAGAPPINGIVVSVGDGVTAFKVGDEVLFENNAGHELKVGDDYFAFFKASEIIGVVEASAG